MKDQLIRAKQRWAEKQKAAGFAPRAVASADRLPPGQGVIDWADVFGLLAEKSYTGLISYEAPNPVLWARSPYEVCREGFELTQALLREAARG